MKLISCYIANFGGLSDYSLKFDDGLTALLEPNGFGKTTLAEFIRAMFYGFPRASRELSKDRRKRYAPWLGGRFGGNLVFEHEGVRYRIERTFGNKPAADSFAVYDLRTNQKTTRFSKDIGLELFRLDDGSFERSTYFPQLHDAISSLSTDNIQAKLGDLVEDTNDVNNFESAKRALQKKRSTLIPYRGSGGTTGQTQEKISALETKISGSKKKIDELSKKRAELDKSQEKLRVKQGARERTNQKSIAASQEIARKTVVEQYRSLKDALKKDRDDERRLVEQYPVGFPSIEEIDEARKAASAAAGSKIRTAPSPEYQGTKSRIDAETRFQSGVPSEDTFQYYKGLCSSYEITQAKLQATILSVDDANELAEFEKFFSHGLPDEALISECKETRKAIETAKTELRLTTITAEESGRIDQLGKLFGDDIPSDDEINSYKDALATAQKLRMEDQEITAAATAPVIQQDAPVKKSPAPLIAVILGAASIICSILLLIGHSYLFGGCLAGLGVVLLIAAGYLHLKGMLDHVISGAKDTGPLMSEHDKQKLRENEAEIQRLEGAVTSFIARYIEATGSPVEQLQTLQSTAQEYRSLMGKAAQVEQKRSDLSSTITSKSTWLTAQLSPYFGENVPDDAESRLMTMLRRYPELKRCRDKVEQDRSKYTSDLKKIFGEISGFLVSYVDEIDSEGFASQLDLLQIDCNNYVRDRKFVTGQDEQREQERASLEHSESVLSNFSKKYGIAAELDPDALQRIRSDVQKYFDLSKSCSEKEATLVTYRQEHEALLDAPESEEDYGDLEGLKESLEILDREIKEISGDIHEREMEIKKLQEEVDEIPELEDELEDLEMHLDIDRKNAGLLDMTIKYLEEAKQRLSTSYLAPIGQAFTGYMQEFIGNESERISIAPTLDVSVLQDGQTRELEYFSAGQTDMIMLCMRLALVDVLFKDEPVFIILDDPFVDLDDENTATALSLLREISKSKQIVYLSCNSSRGIH